MKEDKPYQSLHKERIFIGGAGDVEAMINDEQCNVIVDLRAEATESAYKKDGVRWIQVPLKNNSQEMGQEQVIQRGINEVVNAYQNGNKVGFHCGAGRGRAGTIAVGVLLKLGISVSVDEAEEKAKSIRNVVELNAAQKKALGHLFPRPTSTDKGDE